ncbi:MAG: hypothetical protein Q9227_001279 [Pyrenula ochraceoflavens]
MELPANNLRGPQDPVAASVVNGTTCDINTGLTVLIVGAGLGGLTAALGLRQQGHKVKIFESSRLATETGAAIHVAPNANGVLRKLGIKVENNGANTMDFNTIFSPTGAAHTTDLRPMAHLWQHKWYLAHRLSLHTQLREAATSIKGKGEPAELYTSSKVVRVDTKAATITLSSGEIFSGDVVLGADGVHSSTRQFITEAAKPFSSGKSAFRFLLEKNLALQDPETAKFEFKDGEFLLWFGIDRRVVVYPTANNTLLNFVCIHPEEESEATEDWGAAGSVDALVKIYDKFDPGIKKLLGKAHPETLRVWKLLDMKILDDWTADNFALLGDAAHPFLPHQGQGGAQAIEDAVSLAVMFPFGTRREDIPDLLKLYQTARKERADTIQQYTRLAGKDLQSGDPPFDMMQFTNYNFGHDEWDHSTQLLRKYMWSKQPSSYWRMPMVWGPMPGPRQDCFGRPREGSQQTFRTASIRFRTSRTMLQNLFPNDQFNFTSPGTNCFATFSCTTLDNMQWLGGTGYNHIGLYVHGVQYTKRTEEIVYGTYIPILFENLTDPIVSGREELGMPKLYSSIDISADTGSYHVKTGWQGVQWGSFSLDGLRAVSVDPNASAVFGKDNSGNVRDDGQFIYRYIPKIGRLNKGKAESEFPVFVPNQDDRHEGEPGTVKAQVERAWKATNTSFAIDGLDWKQLPTLHHIVSRLAEIPCYEVLEGKIIEGRGVPDVSMAIRLE